MKRAHLRRVKPVECSPSQVESALERYDQVSQGVKRKKRTSAAMIGLALSMGASSLLVPRQNEGATAAELTPTDAATVSAVPSSSAAPAATMVEHVVVKGQTIWQLAHQYKVSVEAIAAANSFKANEVIKVGQVVRIPAGSKAQGFVESTAQSPQLVASADLNHLSVEAPQAAPAKVEAVKVERNASLDRLRQQQDKLRQSLANLRTKDQAAVTPSSAINSEANVIATRPPQAAASQARSVENTQTPSSSPSHDWLHTNQALTAPAAPRFIAQVPRATPAAARPSVQQVAANPGVETVSYQVNIGDTVANIARAHNISPSTLVQANRISDPNFIFVGQILRVPTPQAAAPDARARQATPSQQVATRLSVVPTTTMISAPPVAQPSLGTGNTLQAPSTSGLDPHVENLLSEIKVLRERHRASAPARATTVLNVPAPEAVQAAPSTLPTLSVSTQFNPGGLNAVQAPESATRTRRSAAAVPVRVPSAERQAPAQQPQQIAAAPAGAESYAPLLQPVTGRTVSPDLPPLQGEDSFLPEGAPSFNGYIWPAKGLLTSGYGWRWGRMHAGIDIAADVGTPIFAAADGVIEYSGWNSGGYGNLVEIRHADGSMTRYGHLNQSLVQEGQKVKQGEQIAEMGSTGYSTGPHLHFEVHTASDGGSVDPVAYLPQQ